MGKNDNYTDIILEEIRDQNKMIFEVVGSMQQDVSKIPAMQTDLEELKADTKAVKAVVKDTNRDLHLLEQRTDKLEAA